VEAVIAQHHELSASGAEGWSWCAGKVVMEAGLPDSYSAAADEGTAAHYLAAYCLPEKRDARKYLDCRIAVYDLPDGRTESVLASGDLLENPIELPKNTVFRSVWPITKEMVDCVNDYVSYVHKKVKGGQLFVEQRVHFGDVIGIEHADNEEEAFGTADTLILSKDGLTLDVIDFKYGYGEVRAEENKQMMLYSLVCLHKKHNQKGVLEGFVEKKLDVTDYDEDLA